MDEIFNLEGPENASANESWIGPKYLHAIWEL